jgi:hypothetical protein
MEPNHSFWNAQFKELRQALTHPDKDGRAVELFTGVHAMVHPSTPETRGLVSFDDEAWEGVSDEDARRIPAGGEHSYAWLFWHLARIEDMTMNVLAAGKDQLFLRDGWRERLNAPACDTGNAMDPAAIVRLSEELDIPALKAYRAAVSVQTREVVRSLDPKEYKQKVDPARLQRLLAEGAVVSEAGGLLDYWGGLTIAGLLLMPPTRHNLVHLNEAMKVKRKLTVHS